MAWYRIDKTITGLTKHLLLGVVYIPPEGSKYTNVSAFEECEFELLELLSCNDALVCMCGDFNARTGNLCDLVENNVFNDFGSDSVTGGLSTIMKNHYERKNNDKHCNKYGPLLTDLCKTANVLIVNGRMPHYSSGNPTFKNISTIDYFLCCPMLFQHINNFIVHDGNPSFSDGHSVLEMVLATGLIVTKDNKKNEFKDAICNSTEVYERVSTSLDSSLSNIADATKESVDTIVKSLNDLLLNCAKKCSMLKNKSYGKIYSTKSCKYKDWYDTECSDKRNAFNMARRRYRDNKSEENFKLMKLTGKDYKTIINKSKALHRQKCIEDLKEKESNDQKSLLEYN